jgi:hypothetical protein
LASLLSQPSWRWSVLLRDRIDDEPLVPQAREREILAAGEWMRARERSDTRFFYQDLDLELGLSGQQPRECDVDRAVEDVVDAAEETFANADVDRRESRAKRPERGGQ